MALFSGTHFGPSAAPATTEETDLRQRGDIIIEVTGLENDEGLVQVSLYNSGDGWPKELDKAVSVKRVAIKNQKATIAFKDLPFGTYAAGMLHDLNGNRDMDFNFIGIPQEGWGFTRIPAGTKRRIKFREAMFRHREAKHKERIAATYF